MLRRHDLAYLRSDAELSVAELDEPASAWLCHWLRAGKPLVVTRQEQATAGLRLGAVLPARLRRRRLGCIVQRSAIVHTTPPLPLEDALGLLPPAVADALQSFAVQAAALAVGVGVYGLTAWEYLAREPYRSATSDVDLVCDVTDRRALVGCLPALARAAERSPARVDGEIRFPDGQAVAWRELLQSRLSLDAKVLAKGLHSVSVTEVGTLLESLA